MCALVVEPRIETARLVLRPLRLDDAWRIADLANDYDIARMVTRIPHPFALADAEAFVARTTAGLDAEREQVFAIDHRQFGLIGVLGFTRKDAAFAEIGYWVGRTFWGRGFVSEAVDEALAWSRQWGRRAIIAGHFVDNPASGRVLVKAGFLYTGEVQTRHCLARGDMVASRMMVWLA